MFDEKICNVNFRIINSNEIHFNHLIKVKNLAIEFIEKYNLSDLELLELKIGIIAYIDQLFHFRSQAKGLPIISKECFSNLRNYRII